MARKFKLIKKYPGSPELGAIYVKNVLSKHTYFSVTPPSSPINERCIENQPEFWEEVKHSLYTSNCGKSIYEGETFFGVNVDSFEVFSSVAGAQSPFLQDFKFGKFYTKKDALDFILENKPSLSWKEIKNMPYMYVAGEQMVEKSHLREIITKKFHIDEN